MSETGPAQARGGLDYFLLYLRGLAMGAADVVPGVSGGTVAFITGIYEELINSIRAVTPAALRVLFTEGIPAFWTRVNGWFLLVLLAGIATSVFSLARVITWLLETWPVLVWSFFLGLIACSAWFVGRRIGHWTPSHIALLVAGAVFAWWLTAATPAAAPLTLLNVFLAGCVAICAMILPGISGSFILLLLGMYAHVLGAVKDLQFEVLGVFAGGCLVGLLLFSHVLGWLLERYHWGTLSVLTGFMVGSLNKVWPWKQTLTWRTNSHGEEVPLLQANVLPGGYTHATGLDAMLPAALLCMAGGLVLVWGIDRVAGGPAKDSA